MVEVYKTVSKTAPTDATVIIEGETGTGKDLVARMIHRFSQRKDQAFVPVDCGSIAPSLLESELFGAMRGAFTGADRDRVGVFEAANRGTVFLDEIGDIEQNFQLALLRFLESHEIRPVGASRSKTVDVRVLAATNRDLQRMVQEKQVPRRFVAPPERGAHRHAAAARAPHAIFRCWRSFLRSQVQTALRAAK
jgi:transcriptional regulator with GAF, ATPase, and Fis domain